MKIIISLLALIVLARLIDEAGESPSTTNHLPQFSKPTREGANLGRLWLSADLSSGIAGGDRVHQASFFNYGNVRRP